MSKSAIYTANTTAQTVAAGSTVPLGSIIRRFGCAVNLNGDTISLMQDGYYSVDVSVTAGASTTISLFKDGVEVVGATATDTNPCISCIVRVPCCNDSSLSLVAETEADITNVAVKVVKL